MEIPLSRPAFEHIDHSFVDGPIELALRLSGWLLARDENDDGPRFASAPQPDEWVFQAFGEARDTSLRFQIARSEWFTRVLEPIGTTEYICTEVAIPRGDHPLRAKPRITFAQQSKLSARGRTPRSSLPAERRSKPCPARRRRSSPTLSTRASATPSTLWSWRPATIYTSAATQRMKGPSEASSRLIMATLPSRSTSSSSCWPRPRECSTGRPARPVAAYRARSAGS